MSFEITIGSCLLTIFEWILECMGGKLTFKKSIQLALLNAVFKYTFVLPATTAFNILKNLKH